MANKRRLIEIREDGILETPVMDGEKTIGVRYIDLSSYPTVDAVEVVRCKDCKHYAMWADGRAMNHCDKRDRSAYDDDYCSYGERRCE